MKLTLLKSYEKNVEGDILEFEEKDVEVAKGLVAVGIAKEFVEETDEELLESFKAIARAEAKAEFADQVKAMAKKSKLGLRVEDVHDNYEDDPRGACKNIGVFFKEVRDFSVTKNMSDNLKKAVTLGDTNNETIGADGGILVPDELSATILEHSSVNGELNLLDRVSTLTVSGNNMTFPEFDNADQSAAGTRNSGILVNWTGETSAKTLSKLKFKESTYRLHKLTALVPVSDELLEDTVALESRITSKTGSAITDEINQVIIDGSGTGRPTGIINSGGTVLSPTDANRTTAAPITVAGLTGMYDRLLNRANALWFINQEMRSSISQLVLGDTPIMSGANLQGDPFQFILGIPVVWSDIAKAPATVGDIILMNPAGYQAIVKGGVQSAVSIHLFFDQDVTTFRFVFRIDGKPMFDKPVTPLNGANDLSDFVTLATTT